MMNLGKLADRRFADQKTASFFNGMTVLPHLWRIAGLKAVVS